MFPMSTYGITSFFVTHCYLHANDIFLGMFAVHGCRNRQASVLPISVRTRKVFTRKFYSFQTFPCANQFNKLLLTNLQLQATTKYKQPAYTSTHTYTSSSRTHQAATTWHEKQELFHICILVSVSHSKIYYAINYLSSSQFCIHLIV